MMRTIGLALAAIAGLATGNALGQNIAQKADQKAAQKVTQKVTEKVTEKVAQNLDVIEQREEHFERMGKAVKEPVKMFKGDAEFDLAAVQAALKLIQEKAVILPTLFPDDSKVGDETEALPAIWDNKPDFESRFKKLGDDAKAAAAAITDKATFDAQFKDVMGNCSGCHKKYRKEKDKS